MAIQKDIAIATITACFFDLDTNKYTRDIISIRKVRRNQFILDLTIASCILLVGLIVGTLMFVKPINTKEQLAEILIKPLSR